MKKYRKLKPFDGLACVNIELTLRCNKNCWCCGRRKIEKERPELLAGYGDMDVKLMRTIACQLPEGIVVQLHNNGEPLLYPFLGHAIRSFNRQITQFDTNGKLILAKMSEIINELDVLTISVIENDPEAEQQYQIIKDFLSIKGDKKPQVVLRLNGQVDKKKYEKLGVLITTRTLHSPMGSFDYRRQPTIPEIGICWDMLHHLSIDRFGRVSVCVRFDPRGDGIIGDANTESLWDIWNGLERQRRKCLHVQGKRSEVPLCKDCDYWGVPTGKD
jgi:MoaA/NifB/PqqE/SkfB family radical SAM enzyme